MSAEIFDGTAWLPISAGQTVKTETHTYAIEGDVETDKLFVPFHVAKSTEETLSLVSVTRRANGGTGTFTIRRNGTGVGSFSSLSVNDTKQTTNATPVTVSNGDEISMILASGALTGWATFTLVFERFTPVTSIV